jgi:hypothetical protein
MHRILSAPLLAALAWPVAAADPAPEIQRPAATPQAVGAVHTLRTIPEACARIEGRFTGEPAAPYKFNVVRTSASCQPRARLVDAGKVHPQAGEGWIFNDLIRVPRAGCATQQAVVRIWRRPAGAAPPELDAQGRSRIYLEQSQQQAQAGKLPPVPLYAAALSIEGETCR